MAVRLHLDFLPSLWFSKRCHSKRLLSKKGFVFLKNGLFVRGETERPFSPKGCSIFCKGLFVYKKWAMCFCEMCCSFIRQLWFFCQRSVIFLTDSSDGFAERLWSVIVVDTKNMVATTKYFMVVTSRRLTTITKTKTAGIWFYAITFWSPGRFSFLQQNPNANRYK